MRIALIGQPNSGKSTLFNSVAGYKSITSNLPGTTVKYTESRIRLNGQVYDLVDFPGTYSLSSNSEAESELGKYLLSATFDLIINVIDASQLGRSLPLTLELMELNIPMIIALNMMDEAGRKGIKIDIEQLSQRMGLPVKTTVASKNLGVRDLFDLGKKVIDNLQVISPKKLVFQRDVEAVVGELESVLTGQQIPFVHYPTRFLALKCLEDDEYYLNLIQHHNGSNISRKIKNLQKKLVDLRGRPQDSVLLLERNAIAMEIYQQVVSLGQPSPDWRDRLDAVIMHRIGGYVILVMVLVTFFYTVFQLGALVENYLLQGFDIVPDRLGTYFHQGSFLFHLLKSILWGISGGAAIVLPYLLPFLIGLTLLEDMGYLPRVAFLMDAFMHRIGLHGTSILPAVLGYGCNVPAVMATRILPSRRDKIIAAVISSMVPCSARSIVILGLVAFYLGPLWAFAIYVLNVLVIALTGKILSRLMPEISPGMILEIPPIRWPSLRVIRMKTWFRVKEFIMVAWPVLILGSLILGMLEYFELDKFINAGFSPLTHFLGLPEVVGTTLIFGVLRKELALVMLTQAIGTPDVITVLSSVQILTFTIFITFYIPCVATIAVLGRELSRSWMMMVVGITFFIATFLASLVQFFADFL